MLLKPVAAPGTSDIPTKYRFKKPAKLRIRRKDGTTVLEGFGIGETIAIMEPRVQLLVCRDEPWTNIPMPGGQTIVEYPEDIALERVHE